MKVAIPLAKNVLAPLGITAAASAIDAGIQKKIHGSGTTTLIISNKEINDIMKIVQAFEDSNILLKGGFSSMLFDTLGASLLWNLLSRKGIVRAGSENKKGKRNWKSWLWKRMGFLMSPHPLTNFEIQKYY